MRLLVFNDPHRGFSKNTSKIHDAVFASIDRSSFDAILVCGDWGTSKTEHVKGAFKAFRTAFPDKLILGVLGNHDFWDKHNTISLTESSIARYAKEFNIHLLEHNPLVLGSFLFLGFNGWYANVDPKTLSGERRWIRGYTQGTTTDDYFQTKAKQEVEFIKNYPKEDKTVIVVSHFPCVAEAMDKEEYCGDPSFGLDLLPQTDFMFFGHTHQSLDMVKGKTRIINVGSGYQEEKNRINEVFKYRIINLEEKHDQK